MRTEKDILKIKTVLLYLLNKYDQGVDYITIFKLLYLAQKKHLSVYGIPLFKDDFYAFQAGPAPSITYYLCKIADGKLNKNTRAYKTLYPYSESIEITTKKKGNSEIKYVKTTAVADKIRLSKSNIRVLDEVFDKYHQYSPGQLSKISHDAAWQKTWEEGSVNKMSLTNVHFPKAMKDYIMDNISLNGME